MIEGVHLGRLARWMDQCSLGQGPIVDVQRLGGGTQNILLVFRRGDRRFVVRRPPLHKRKDSDKAMMREATVLNALAGTPVPHPALIVSCEDQDVLGAAFYIMEPVEGANPTQELPPPYIAERGWRRSSGRALADGAAAIGALDYISLGLGDFGKIRRISGTPGRSLARSTRIVPALAGRRRTRIARSSLCRRLVGEKSPCQLDAWSMHGDYHMAMFLWPMNVLALPPSLIGNSAQSEIPCSIWDGFSRPGRTPTTRAERHRHRSLGWISLIDRPDPAVRRADRSRSIEHRLVHSPCLLQAWNRPGRYARTCLSRQSRRHSR